MRTTFDVLIPGAPVETREVELPEDPGYTKICEILKPWFSPMTFEHVVYLKEDRTTYADMFVDEMGHPKKLPYNEPATAHYHRNAQVNGIPGWQDVTIVGPAIVFHRKVWF